MARKIDYKLNPPKHLSDLNLPSMVAYVKENATDKERKTFKEFCQEHHDIVKEYRFDTPNGTHKKGEQYTTYDLPKIRREFARMFFSYITEKKTTKKETPSIDDEINSL